MIIIIKIYFFFNLTIQTNDICTTQNLSRRMRHKLLWDFDIQTNHLISARSPDLIIINNKKENLQNCDLCCPSWSQNKLNKNEKKYKYLDFARELKKLWNMKVTIILIVIGALGTVTKKIKKGTGGLGN